MLKQLSIDSFALISHAEVPFHEGFTAITGETGAGKSVLLKALRMVCGDKAQASMVRTGEEKVISFTLISHSSCARAPVAYSTLRSVISRCPVIVVGFGQDSMIFTSSCEKYLMAPFLGSFFFGIF